MIFNTDLYEIFIPAWGLIGIATLFTFGVTFFAIPVLVRVSRAKGLVALPDGITSHGIPTPILGGVAIFAGMIISTVLFTGITQAHEVKYIIAGMFIIFFVGLKDDLYPMVAYKKFLGQLLATLIIVVPGDVNLLSFNGLFGIYDVSYPLSIIISTLLFLALINSFTLIDGIDGLAAGIGILIAVFFGISFLIDARLTYAVMSFILTASLLAFFYFNVFSKKYKIFLGDTGAMMIGLLLAIFAIRFLNFEVTRLPFSSRAAPGVLICILIIPFFDTARVFILRIFRRQHPFKADQTPLHHRLLELSGSHLKATSIMLAVNVFFIGLALTLREISSELLILLAITLAAFLSIIPVYLKNVKNR